MSMNCVSVKLGNKDQARDFPGGPVVKTPYFQCRGLTCQVARPKKTQTNQIEQNDVFPSRDGKRIKKDRNMPAKLRVTISCSRGERLSDSIPGVH